MTNGFGMGFDQVGIVYDCKSTLFTAQPISPEAVSSSSSLLQTSLIFPYFRST